MTNYYYNYLHKMTKELLEQITKITNILKDIKGVKYAEQYYNTALNLIHNNPDKIEEYKILIGTSYKLLEKYE